MSLRLNIGNLDNVEDGFAAIPENVYKCQVSEVKLKTSKQGNEMVNVRFRVLEPVDFMGRSGFANLVLVPDALWKLKQFCKACGIGWDANGVDIEAAIGKELFIKVTQRSMDTEKGPRIVNDFDGFVTD